MARTKQLQKLWLKARSRPKRVLPELRTIAPNKAGVYCIWKNLELEYVGETRNISRRMRDLLDSRHHTFRRSLGQQFSKRTGYRKASSWTKFDEATEKLIEGLLHRQYKISFYPLSFGRKELEEYIIETKKPVYNLKQAKL
jgi:hypothetical protein